MCKYISMTICIYACLWLIASLFIGNIVLHHDEMFLDEYNPKEMKNVILINGDIDQSSMDDAVSKLRTYKRNRESKEINIFLNTNGGSVFPGYFFILEMESMKLENMVINCYAKKAASFGFNIFQYCDNRYVSKDAYLYIHDVSMKLNLEGNLDTIEDYYINKFTKIKAVYNEINSYVSRRIKLDHDEYMKRLKKEWLIIGGRNILRNKLADKMVHIHDF